MSGTKRMGVSILGWGIQFGPLPSPVIGSLAKTAQSIVRAGRRQGKSVLELGSIARDRPSGHFLTTYGKLTEVCNLEDQAMPASLPPSIGMIAPVMNVARSEHSQEAV